nr:herbivore elicitor-regulated 1 [Ipomoea batatas]
MVEPPHVSRRSNCVIIPCSKFEALVCVNGVGYEVSVVALEFLTPYVLLRLPDKSVATDDVPESAPINGLFLRYKWYRIQSDKKITICSVHPSEQATLQCLGCVNAKIPVAKSYHCSPKCFANSCKWSSDDVGHVLKFECVVLEAETNIPVGHVSTILTSRVIPPLSPSRVIRPLSPTPRRLISVREDDGPVIPAFKKKKKFKQRRAKAASRQRQLLRVVSDEGLARGAAVGVETHSAVQTIELEAILDFFILGQLEKSAFSAADELFDGGKIKPLKPPPRFQYEGKPPDSPKSPKQRIKEAFSPRHRRKDFDPFSAAIEQSRKDDKDDTDSSNQRRGRDPTAARSNSRHKGTRSLSPFRISDLLLDRDENTCSSSSSSSSSSAAVSSFISMWYRKWKLKDLLLFRSASEGRASSKEMMNKYAMLKKSHHHDDVKNASFRSTESAGSTSRRRGPVSAHELHYTVNRAASEEMKRKTFLPYKQGLLGCLGVHPTVPEISKGLASMSMPRTRQQ